MSGYGDDLSAFLKDFGFPEEELCAIIDELNSFSSKGGLLPTERPKWERL
jgi:hypothetical protein